jgi:hypothetical protein
MRAKQFLRESVGATLYHVTLTKNVKKIQSKGILPLQTSNWVQAGTGERYGGGYIFAFEYLIDAARWAAKWDWEISHKMGSGKVSVMTFTDDVNDWETDDADPLGQSSARGKWMKKHGHVPPQNIKSVQPATMDLLKTAVHESIIPTNKSVLFEYSRQVTAQKLGDKLLAVAKQDKSIDYNIDHSMQPDAPVGISLDWLIGGFEEMDPTPHKEYTQWLCKTYAAQLGVVTKYEDFESRGSDSLARFHKLKTKQQLKPEHRDINRFRSLQDFEQTVASYPEPQDVAVDKGHAKEIYTDANLRVIQPMDEAAAKYYGQGTKWCTAAKNNNMFERYAQMGPLYIILLTTPERTGEKYQLHFESSQYMDEQDQEIPPYQWKSLLSRCPQLIQLFGQKANLNLCIPLMPAREKLIAGWKPMMDDICYTIAKNLPIEPIIRKAKGGLRGAMVSGESIANRVIEALRGQLEEDNYGLMDIFAANITPLNIGSRDELFDEIMMDPLSDWITDGATGDMIGVFADDDVHPPTIDSFGAYMEITDTIFTSVFFKLKNAICTYARSL